MHRINKRCGLSMIPKSAKHGPPTTHLSPFFFQEYTISSPSTPTNLEWIPFWQLEYKNENNLPVLQKLNSHNHDNTINRALFIYLL